MSEYTGLNSVDDQVVVECVDFLPFRHLPYMGEKFNLMTAPILDMEFVLGTLVDRLLPCTSFDVRNKQIVHDVLGMDVRIDCQEWCKDSDACAGAQDLLMKYANSIYEQIRDGTVYPYVVLLDGTGLNLEAQGAYTIGSFEVVNNCGYNDDSRSHRIDQKWDDDGVYVRGGFLDAEVDPNAISNDKMYPEWGTYVETSFSVKVALNDGKLLLQDLMEAVYSVKGSKYDFCYEMFVGFDISTYTDTDGKMCLIFNTTFDHGS